jgi:BolA protein
VSAGGTDVASTLRARLARLAPLVLEVHDDSAEHAGHAGAAEGARHFSVLIVSNAFSGAPRLARHQRVLREVADLLPHPVHALSIKALAPEEFPF